MYGAKKESYESLADKSIGNSPGRYDGSAEDYNGWQTSYLHRKPQMLLLFSENEVRLMLKQGQCIISGKNFVIKAILPEEILLEGTIDVVRYVES